MATNHIHWTLDLALVAILVSNMASWLGLHWLAFRLRGKASGLLDAL